MSRLYQAIAYEESENAKKEFSDENKNKESSEDYETNENSIGYEKQKLSKYEGFNNLKEDIIDENNEEDVHEEELGEEEEDVEADYEEDYTASTASSDESETEKFKRAVQSANLKPQFSNELDTYHPRDMAPRTITTYRSSDPNQAIEVLTKPLPLPNPDFVPKPILKRPKQSLETAEKPAKTPKPKKSTSKKGRILKQLFDRDKKKDEEQVKTQDDVKKELEASKQQKLAEEKKKLAAMRQDSIEEAKVAIDVYSDIVRERGSVRKSTVPIYLDPQNMQFATDEEDETQHETVTQNDQNKPLFFSTSPLIQRKYSKPDILAPSLSPTLSQPLSPPLSPPISPPLSPQPSDAMINNNPRISRKLSTDSTPQSRNTSQDRIPRSRNTSQERKPRSRVATNNNTGSRSNSLVRQRSNSGQTNLEIPSNNIIKSETISVAPKMRSRNTSRSPVVKNRIHLENNKMAYNNHIPPSPSPNQDPKHLAEIQIETHEKVKSQMAYLTDIGLFIAACWLYFLKDARLALPVILLIVYRQLSDAIKDRLPNWVGKKS